MAVLNFFVLKQIKETEYFKTLDLDYSLTSSLCLESQVILWVHRYYDFLEFYLFLLNTSKEVSSYCVCRMSETFF